MTIYLFTLISLRGIINFDTIVWRKKKDGYHITLVKSNKNSKFRCLFTRQETKQLSVRRFSSDEAINWRYKLR